MIRAALTLTSVFTLALCACTSEVGGRAAEAPKPSATKSDLPRRDVEPAATTNTMSKAPEAPQPTVNAPEQRLATAPAQNSIPAAIAPPAQPEPVRTEPPVQATPVGPPVVARSPDAKSIQVGAAPAPTGSQGAATGVSIILVLVIALRLLIGRYRSSAAMRARKTAAAAVKQFESALGVIQDTAKAVEGDVSRAAKEYVQEVTIGWLAAIPLDEVRKIVSGVRMQPLLAAGKTRLLDCHGWTASHFQRYHGIGPDSAAKLAIACETLSKRALQQDLPHPTVLGSGAGGAKLYARIYTAEDVKRYLAGQEAALTSALAPLQRQNEGIARATTFSRWLLSLGKKESIVAAVRDADGIQARLAPGKELDNILCSARDRLAAARNSRETAVNFERLQSHVAENTFTYATRIMQLLGTTPSSTGPHSAGGGSSRELETGIIVVASAESPVAVRAREAVEARFVITQPTSDGGSRSADSTQSRPDTRGSRSAEWVPLKSGATVHGFTLAGVYIGRSLRAVQRDFVEPALIDPNQPVSRNAANCHERMLDYWSSYTYASPAARGSYLQWHATGRSDPEADVGYVFLFLYGLERRALFDATRDSAAAADIPAIIEEVKRLRGIYGGNRSFDGYSRGFLEILAFTGGGKRSDAAPDLPDFESMWLSTELKRGLGTFAVAGKPLPAKWAYVWYHNDPRSRLPTAAKRCHEEALALFEAEYAREFPGGFVLPPNKTQLKVTYRPASGSFCEALVKATELPDVTVLNGPYKKIEQIALSCFEQLAPYSRFLGKNPGARTSLEAALLLPPQIWASSVRTRLSELLETSSQFSHPRHTTCRELLGIFATDVTPTRAKYLALSEALETLNVGIEPDLRLGGTIPDLDDPIAIFSCSGTPMPDARFGTAALLLELGCAVASADGDFSDIEAEKLEEYFASNMRVAASEKQRLMARMAVYRAKPRPMTALKKMADGIAPELRAAVLDFLFTVVHADGVVAPSEVSVMEKLYRLFGLDVTTLYTRLHGVAAGSQQVEAKVVERAGPIVLDRAKIERLLADSAAVTAKLTVIFDNTEVEIAQKDLAADQEPAEPKENTRTLLGLDPAHSEFLAILLERAQWTRAELEELSADKGLMLDGAIETINEAAFDKYNEPIIAGADPFEISVDLLSQIAA